jgi:hypothetical protein
VPGSGIVILPYQLDTNDMKMWTDPSLTPDRWLDYAIRCFDSCTGRRRGQSQDDEPGTAPADHRPAGADLGPRGVSAPRAQQERRVGGDAAGDCPAFCSREPDVTLRLEQDGPVARLIIDRADKRNAFTQAMWEALPGLVAEAMAQPATRLLVLQSADPSVFSAGRRHRGVLRRGRATRTGARKTAPRSAARNMNSPARPSRRWR